MHSVFLVCSFYTVFAHLSADRNQLDNNLNGSSLRPENMARQLGFTEEAEPGMRRKNQGRETDQPSGQDSGYGMMTPCTMMVISI